MLILVVLLVVTNLATLAVIGLLLLRRLDHPAPGPAVARTLDAGAAPPEISSTATRQVISIEILNPIELAGTRGRWAGLAGSLVPGITKRVVHDQAMKMVRRTLLEEKVVADVRLHTIRPPQRTTTRPDRRAAARAAQPARATGPRPAADPGPVAPPAGGDGPARSSGPSDPSGPSGPSDPSGPTGGPSSVRPGEPGGGPRPRP